MVHIGEQESYYLNKNFIQRPKMRIIQFGEVADIYKTKNTRILQT